MSATRATKQAASPATKPQEENRGKSVWVEAPDGSVGRRQPGWEDAPEPEPESAPVQVKPTRKPRTPAKKVATPAKAKPAKVATPAKVKEAQRLLDADKPAVAALTHNQAIAAYCKQRTLLHGAGPLAYRQAAAKALGITDAAFEAAFYKAKAPKAEGKA